MGRLSAHCNACGGDRNHDLLHSEQRARESASFDVRGIDTYEMLKCSGCGDVKLRHTSLSDEKKTVTYYPPASFRPEPQWMEQLWIAFPPGHDAIHDLLKQVYVALQNGLLALAAMGIRAVIESTIIYCCKDQGSFVKNLAAFERDGLVSRLERQHIEAVLEAGHAAIHRGFAPGIADLTTLLDITENLLQVVFLHPEKVEALRNRVPRKRRNAG